MQSQTTLVDWPTLLADPDVQTLLALALREDIGDGDVTTRAIFSGASPVSARVVSREPTIVCGVPLAQALLARFDASAAFTRVAAEGTSLEGGAVLFELRADVRAILTAERTVLNFLMRLCGIAKATREAVDAIPPGARAQIYDTRKTAPGFRALDKAAVRTGGGQNHRMGLYDAILIKDNHVQAAGTVAEAVRRARAAAGSAAPVEVEIDRLEQLEDAIAAGANIILLDNMDEATMRNAVRRARGRVELEASGGVTLERVAAIARTGVDRISMGSLTHTVTPADLSLEIL